VVKQTSFRHSVNAAILRLPKGFPYSQIVSLSISSGDLMMDYRYLGTTGIQVSKLCLGTENFGPRTSEADSFEIIDCALENGINIIDTANFYGTEQPDDYSERRGQSEVILGKALKRNQLRDKVFISTKVRGPMWPGPNGEGASRWHILRAVEDSLRRLQTDYIDLYQIHWPDPNVPIEETLRALDDLIHSGKVRYIGSNNFHAWQLVEAFWASEKYCLNRFVSEQTFYSIVGRKNERELLPMARKYQLGIMVWSPLFGGFLTGKYRRGQTMPQGSRLSDERSERSWPRSYLGDKAYDLIEKLDKLAARKGCTMAQFSIAWVLAQPGITSVLIGPRTLQHLKEYIGAIDVQITDEDRRTIDALVPPTWTILEH
jgi:aryl-alcohol dehydrogenase-like predicted oxidoreductase